MTNHASKIIDAIGHDDLKRFVGLTDRNLRHIRSSGKFPAKLYAPIKEVAEPRGIFVPLEAFNFGPLANKLGSFAGENQAAALKGTENTTQSDHARAPE